MEKRINFNIFKGIRDKVASKLSIQLIVSFLVMFILVVSIGFIILYTGIVKVLSNNSEANTIQKFKQCDFNIGRFCSDIDIISRQLVIDANLQGLTMYGTRNDSDQVTLAASTLRKFTDLINNYKYIDSVVYYGGDGLIIKSAQNGNYIQYDNNSKNDWYYRTRAYSDSKIYKQRIIWYGGYSDHDFEVTVSGSTEKPPIYYISASRNTLMAGNSGTLVINIKESYFTSVYNDSSNSKNNKMYLLDNNGFIISSPAALALTKKYGHNSKIDTALTMGNFIMEGDKGKVQVVYYKLSNSIGTLVDEIPVSEILKDTIYLRNTLVILFLLSLAIALILSRFWIFKLLGPLSRLTGIIRKIGRGNLGLTLDQTSKNELGVLVDQFNQMSTSIKDLFHKNELVQTEKRNMEMEALRSQINPHFIYNTLNTIKWMAVINKADNIVDSVTTLSDFLEPIFKKHDILCTLEEEISYIKNYVKIMNYRFADGFKLYVDIPESLLKCRMIRFILQPIVENALVHGLMDKVTGKVGITAFMKGLDLLICIRDDGNGMEEQKLNAIRATIGDISPSDQVGIGLSNVDRRVKLHFGEVYGLLINSSLGSGTEVVLRMPYLSDIQA